MGGNRMRARRRRHSVRSGDRARRPIAAHVAASACLPAGPPPPPARPFALCARREELAARLSGGCVAAALDLDLQVGRPRPSRGLGLHCILDIGMPVEWWERVVACYC
ncbi:hypothetical protein SEVIR_6G191802v4 [Setaria viridis]